MRPASKERRIVGKKRESPCLRLLHVRFYLRKSEKSKLPERTGRKATGLTPEGNRDMAAGLPGDSSILSACISEAQT
jgi:hypothetical protein